MKGCDPKSALEFPRHWKNADVRGALRAMQGWVCAYCNSELPDNDRGDGEHFRPKSPSRDGSHQGYWWLAYTFDNYLLACRVCNSEQKIDRFPVEATAAHVGYAERATINDELRLLIDPVADPVEDWIRVDWTHELCCTVFAVSTAKSHPGAHLRAEVTIGFFGLNSNERILLIQARVRARDKAIDLFNELSNETKSEAKRGKLDQLRRLASRYRPHGRTVRAFLEDLADEVTLPSAEEELEWLLEDVDNLLNINARCLTDNARDDDRERQIEELRWMLAVLWKDPPAGTPVEIASWLDERGWRAMVESVYTQLGAP